MSLNDLNKIARKMVKKGKGVLAADESAPTCKKRFDSINVESTDLSRNKYRDMLFTTPDMEKFISGVILFEETLGQSTIKENISFPDYLTSLDVIPGIKVDKGAHALANNENEKVTEGLDGLGLRLAEYFKLGARFAKWRAVITISDENPSGYAISTNAHALARYASLCQSNDIVPIVEPEILMNGKHDIDDSFVVTEEVLHTVFFELYSQGVQFEEMVLKPNMVLSGYECSNQASVDEVANATLECFMRTVPVAVPGIAFLSGGQSDKHATAHLNKMNQLLSNNKPWNLTFSYGRALQQVAINTWAGVQENTDMAQKALLHRAKLNSLASMGEYSKDME